MNRGEAGTIAVGAIMALGGAIGYHFADKIPDVPTGIVVVTQPGELPISFYSSVPTEPLSKTLAQGATGGIGVAGVMIVGIEGSIQVGKAIDHHKSNPVYRGNGIQG